MGNWRTVNIIGTCNENEVSALREACTVDKDYNNFHCLSILNSICGLNNWVGSNIKATGNLAERDYSVKDVKKRLKKLVKVAPSLSLKVHCGDDYESKDCIATITVKDGVVTVGEPEIESLDSLDEGSMRNNLLSALMNTRM